MPLEYVENGDRGRKVRDTINAMIDLLLSLDAPTLEAALLAANAAAAAALEASGDATAAASAATDAAEEAISAVGGALLRSGGSMVGPLVTAQVLQLGGSLQEKVGSISTPTPHLQPQVTGTMVAWTPTANSTPTLGFVSGESMLLIIGAGTRTITWPAGIGWRNGIAPILRTNGWSFVTLWRHGNTYFGAW